MHRPMAELHLPGYKRNTTHSASIRSDEGLTLKRSLRWPIHIVNPVDKIIKPNYLQLGLVAGMLFSVLGDDFVLPQVVCQIERPV